MSLNEVLTFHTVAQQQKQQQQEAASIQQAKTCTTRAIPKGATATCHLLFAALLSASVSAFAAVASWLCFVALKFRSAFCCPSVSVLALYNRKDSPKPCLSLHYLRRPCLASAMVATDKAAKPMVTIAAAM